MFTIRSEQSAQMRSELLGKGLIQSFAGTSMVASRDAETGDVLVSDPSGNVHRFGFDGHGFIGSIKSPMGRVWSLLNDGEGRLVTSTAPSGQRMDLRYSMRGQISQVIRDGHLLFRLDYDPQGNLIQAEYPDRTTTKFSYDSAGRITSVVDRLRAVDRYQYNDDGDLIAIINTNGQRTSFSYGRWNRPDSVSYPDGSTETYAYHPSGLLRRIAAGEGDAIEIDYDGGGRPSEVRYSDGEILRFEYDAKGRLTRASNPTAILWYSYNDADQVIEEVQGEHCCRYLYDKRGTLVEVVGPSGDSVEFGYDADQRLAHISDWHRNTYNIEYMDGDAGYTITSARGLVTDVRLGSGGPLSIDVAMVEHRTRPVFRVSYEYDEEDRVRSTSDSIHGSRRYTYDPEGRLLSVSAEDPVHQEVFAYDACGNRTRVGRESAAFDAGNRLLRQGDVSCSYDKRGNLVSISGPRGEWRFAYNARNLLVRAEGADGQRVEFGYDAFGRRLWKRSEACHVRYIWSGENLIREEVNGVTASTRDYLYVPGTHTPFAVRVDGRIYCYHTDRIGTPRLITDEVGRVVWSADYSAFGAASVQGSLQSPLRFPGQYYDEETGLHYNRFRYYSPWLGRYLSRDPLTFLAGNNFYAYVRNDPINAIDPTGLWGWPSWKTVVTAVAAVAVGVAVVAFAPVTLPAAIILGGMAAGATGVMVNRALNGQDFCLSCTIKGAIAGGLAAIPFVFLPATASVGAFMGVGALSGAIQYTADHALNYPNAKWDWGEFGESVGFGAITAGALRYLGGKYANSKENPGVEFKPNTGARDIPEGGISVQERVNQGGKPPEWAQKNPDRYYYDPEAKAYKVRPEPKPDFSGSNQREIPCFPRGTLVATECGQKPIETLDVGVQVLSFDVIGRATLSRAILGLLQNKAVSLFEILVGNEAICATSQHRFWVDNHERWIAARYLDPGMRLRTKDDRLLAINTVNRIEVEEQPTYNLSISDCHTYFVGEAGVLVHNEGDTPTGKIYIGRNPDGEIIYVGQTKQDLGTRESQHHQEASEDAEKYGWKKDMKLETVEGMDGLTDEQMDYHERRIYDELKEKGYKLKNSQTPMGDEKINALKEKYCP